MVQVCATLLVAAAAIEVVQQVAGREHGRVYRQQLEVLAHRRRLDFAVPTLEVLAPQLALEHRRARRQTLLDLGMARGEIVPDLARRVPRRVGRRPDRLQTVIREALDEAVLHVLEQPAVASQALAEAALERLGEELRVKARERPREVGPVEEPRSRARRCERWTSA